MIIHCWIKLSEPRRLRGANSAMYAVAIAESAPIASPMSVRALRSMPAFKAAADRMAPTA